MDADEFGRLTVEFTVLKDTYVKLNAHLRLKRGDRDRKTLEDCYEKLGFTPTYVPRANNCKVMGLSVEKSREAVEEKVFDIISKYRKELHAYVQRCQPEPAPFNPFKSTLPEYCEVLQIPYPPVDEAQIHMKYMNWKDIFRVFCSQGSRLNTQNPDYLSQKTYFEQHGLPFLDEGGSFTYAKQIRYQWDRANMMTTAYVVVINHMRRRSFNLVKGEEDFNLVGGEGGEDAGSAVHTTDKTIEKSEEGTCSHHTTDQTIEKPEKGTSIVVNEEEQGQEKLEAADQTIEKSEKGKSILMTEEQEHENVLDNIDTHYSVLGVSYESTLNEIHESFIEISKRYIDGLAGAHADMSDLKDIYKRASAAHKVLSDQHLRNLYDEQLGGKRGTLEVYPSNEAVSIPSTGISQQKTSGKEPEHKGVEMAVTRFWDKFSKLSNNLNILASLTDTFDCVDMDPDEYEYKEEDSDRLNIDSMTMETFNAAFDDKISQLCDSLKHLFASMKQKASGNFRKIKYLLGRRRQISETLDYFEAIVLFEDNLKEEVCFLLSNNVEKALSVYTFTRDVYNYRVGRPTLYFKHNNLPLLSYDKFDNVEVDLEQCMRLAAPRSRVDIEGYPNRYTQAEIKGIIEGAIHLEDAHRMSSEIGDRDGFVLTPKRNVRILRVDMILEEDVRGQDIKRLGDGVYKLLLDEGENKTGQTGDDGDDIAEWSGYLKEHDGQWEHRRLFMELFHHTRVKMALRLTMLSHQPILKATYWDVIQIFPDLHRAIEARATYLNMSLWGFINAINLQEIKKDFLIDDGLGK